MLYECFPNQFHQPKRLATTDLDKTREIPKDLNTRLHNQTPPPLILLFSPQLQGCALAPNLSLIGSIPWI